jgi:hypothetical protein
MSKTRGQIRKITIGPNPLMGMAFEVGRKHRAGKDNEVMITQIVEDFEHFHEFGHKRFMVEAQEYGGEPFVWKEFENIPVLLEYSLPTGEEIQKI